MSPRTATLTEEEISSILQTFRYDRESGEIIRLAASDPQHQWLVGKPCGHIGSGGYTYMLHRGKSYLTHRMAFLLETGEWPKGVVDHINRVKTDNRWCNLRLCDHSQSSQNVAVAKNNKSGARGVRYCDKRRRWIAMIMHRGEKHWLGSFKNMADAVKARADASVRLHKEFAGELVKFTEANHG